MGYLFGIVLCFTFLATLNFWHRTRGEREEAAKRRAAAKDVSKTCGKGWHNFGRWENSPRYHNAQQRYCNLCGIREERIVE